jgi:hypothetical protein
MLKKFNLLVAASIASASAFAAYGPAAPAAPAASSSNWTLGFGYGQMFGMKKTTTAADSTANPNRTASTDAKVKNPTLMEFDLFNSNGFGAVYMTNAGKKGIVTNGATAEVGKYSFNAYFLGYHKGLAQNLCARVLLGLADQKYIDGSNTEKSDGEFAFAATGAYHMNLSGSLKGFAELGYLDLKKFNYTSVGNQVKVAGFFWKVGVKMPI